MNKIIAAALILGIGALRRCRTAKTGWNKACGASPIPDSFPASAPGIRTAERHGTSPVNDYAKTLSACGAIDMWGNCWEWTSTPVSSRRGKKTNAVKGGSWDSRRTECRTELRGIARDPDSGYANVGFRVIRVK